MGLRQPQTPRGEEMTVVRIAIIPFNDVSVIYSGRQFDNVGAPPEFNMRVVCAGAMDSTAGTPESVTERRLDRDGTGWVLRP